MGDHITIVSLASNGQGAATSAFEISLFCKISVEVLLALIVILYRQRNGIKKAKQMKGVKRANDESMQLM
jgi:hypothetical protein